MASAWTVKETVSIHEEEEEASDGATTGRPWAVLHQMLSRQLLPVARSPAYSGHGCGDGDVWLAVSRRVEWEPGGAGDARGSDSSGGGDGGSGGGDGGGGAVSSGITVGGEDWGGLGGGGDCRGGWGWCAGWRVDISSRRPRPMPSLPSTAIGAPP